jgi:uncharacterized protein (TIGR02001 family)
MRVRLCSILAIAAAAGVAADAAADVDLTVTATSDYDFRGISQSRGEPAFQAGVEYSADWLRASAWTSSVDFGADVDGRRELDLSVGAGHETAAGLEWDVLATRYLYPGAGGSLGDPLDASDDVAPTADYVEWSVGAARGRWSARYWYSPDLYATGASGSYAEAAASFALHPKLALAVHAGYSFGPYFDALTAAAGAAADYRDVSIGLDRSMSRFDVGMRYVWTDTAPAFIVPSGAFRNDPRWIFTVGTTFGSSPSAER